MKFTTTKEKLLSSVLIAERVVGKKESLPVLSCVLIEAEKQIVVRGTNLESGVSVSVLGDVEEKGVVAVPVHVFSQTLRSIAGEKVTCRLEGDNLLVESRGSRTLIKAVPHSEFPILSLVDKTKKGLKVVRTLFLRGLQSVVYAASTSMIRPELGSVYVTVENGVIVCVATDSFRLAEKTISKAAGEGSGEILIPVRHVLELIHILERIADSDVSLFADESQLVVRGEVVEFVSRVVDATFPNYKDIIPKGFSTEATLLKTDVVETLRKARIFSGQEQRIGFHVYPKKKVFDVTAQSSAVGEMSDSLDGATSGEDIDINFHIGYVAECLPLIDAESVTLGFSGVGKPLVVRGVSDASFTYLVMPLNR